MTSSRRIVFGPHSLDLESAQLWKGDELVALQPRPLAVLRYLAERPGQAVRREELIDTLWAGTYVTKAVLKVAVRAIREALADDADAPRYIETVGREGYRFIGDEKATAASNARTAAARTPVVGRKHDLATLHALLDQSLDGTRKVVLVTGEAGIGKTTLVQQFLDEVERGVPAWIARGQCLEQYGEGEPYLPVLEAIGRLVREDSRNELAGVLRRHAPAWVAQLPSLASEEEVVATDPGTTVTTAARMLREMADAIEVFTRGRALVLLLEDLHWSDRSTIDLIAYLARRREPARLLVLGTFRPTDVIVHDHPLRAVQQELQASGHCEEIALELLAASDVEAYVAARFMPASNGDAAQGNTPGAASRRGAGTTSDSGGARKRRSQRGAAKAGSADGDAANALPPDSTGLPDELRRLATRIYERTEGNALFMVNVVNHLIAQGLLVLRDGRWHVEGGIERATEGIPAGVQELIGRRIARLAPDARRALEVASVAGEEFAVAAVAAGLEQEVDAVEDLCEDLAAGRALIVDAGVAEWPDGSVTGQYRFLHSLYRHVLYEQMGDSRRVRVHRAIGLREESAYGERLGERAVGLAMHFERGRDHARALRYHELAAAGAVERHAAHEAVAHYSAALDALGRQPELADRAERALALEVANATLLMATKGYAAPEVERAFARARALCETVPATPKAYPVLRGLVSYHHVRAELDAACELGEILLGHVARDPENVLLRVQVHYGHGATLFHTGAFGLAREHLERALAEYEPARHREHINVYGGYDPGVACSLWLAWTLLLLGHVDEAATHDRNGLELARRLGDPFTLAWASHGIGVSHQLRAEWAASEERASEAVRLAEEHGFPYVAAIATVNRGWALVMQGKTAVGARILRDGVAAVEATGSALVRPAHLGMLAAVDAMAGDREAADVGIERALAEVERTGERIHQVGLLIGKSRLLAARDGGRGKKRARGTVDEAEACLRRAVEVARAQQARLLELSAALALTRHCHARGRGADAREMLVEAHAWFEKSGSTTPDVAAARELLAQLS